MEAKETDGLGLIRPGAPSELWSNQTGGYACHHPEIHGRFEMIAAKGIESFLECYFTGEAWRGWCTAGDMDEATAVVLDACLEALWHARKTETCFKVDRDRLKESEEAWVYLKGDNDTRAVLVWNNSD